MIKTNKQQVSIKNQINISEIPGNTRPEKRLVWLNQFFQREHWTLLLQVVAVKISEHTPTLSNKSETPSENAI